MMERTQYIKCTGDNNMKCPYCGIEIPKDTKVCPKCKASVVEKNNKKVEEK